MRAFHGDDLDAFLEVMSQPQVGHWLGTEGGFDREGVERWLEMFDRAWNSHGYCPMAVIERSTGRIIGHCGIRYNDIYGWNEFMYALHPDVWNKGYTTEACLKWRDIAFNELDIHEIYSYTLPENTGSRRVMEKLGMEYVKNFVHADLEHLLYVIRRNKSPLTNYRSF